MSGASRGAVLPDRYQVVRLLGKGGMGKVYLAKDQETGRDVAVKVLSVPQHMLQAAAARFRREAKAQARIESPHVVAIYDQQLVEDPPYLVMEYVRGRDLETLLEDEGPMPVDRVVRMVREAAEAIDSLHEVGVIHRDLKPSNLMVREEDGATVLMDLGLAQIEGGTVLTATGQLVGTPLYLPPESMDTRGWCFQSDIYQLGAIAFECLVGRSLLKGSSMEEVVASLTLGEHNEFPPELNVPHEVQDSIRAAVAVDPDERFQSAGEFARAMRGEGAIPAAPTASTLAAGVAGGPGGGAAGSAGMPRLGAGAWAGLLILGLGVGAFLGRPQPAPLEPRWRVVADAVEVRFRPGEAEDIRAEVGDRLVRKTETLDGGEERLVIRGLPVGDPVGARLLWRGGEGPRVQLVPTSPALEDRLWLLTGRRIQLRLRRAASVSLGEAPPVRGEVGEELILQAPAANGPLPPLRWQEDGLDFARVWTWADLYQTAAEGIPDSALLEDRQPLLDALRSGAPPPGVRQAQRYWRQLVPWIPEMLRSDLAPRLRHRVWRGWQALTQAVALEEIHGLQVARPSVPVDEAGGRRRLGAAPEPGAIQWRPVFESEDSAGQWVASANAQRGLPVDADAINAVRKITFAWPRVVTGPEELVDVAFQVLKWREGSIGRLEVEGGTHPFRVDIWHPEAAPNAPKFTGWLVVRLPPDLLPPTGSPMSFRLLPVSGHDLKATRLQKIQLWREKK